MEQYKALDGATHLPLRTFSNYESSIKCFFFDYDTLGDIPLFYVPELPPPALIIDFPRSRWSLDTADLDEVHREAARIRQRVDVFLGLRAFFQTVSDRAPSPMTLPIPAVMDRPSEHWLQRWWSRLWNFVQHVGAGGMFCYLQAVESLGLEGG